MFIVPAPFQGLNTRDNTILQPGEARVLENFLPEGGTCKVRPGYQEHASSGNVVESLFVFASPTTKTLLAGANNKIMDVSSATPTQISSGTITNNFWSTVNFAGKLIGVNGVNAPWIWDGSTYSAATFNFSGLTVSNLNTVSLVGSHLWFTVNNSADTYFALVSAVGGQLGRWQLGLLAEGGKCVDIAAWSIQGGTGPQDAVAFIMDTGEILVYTGDPQSSFALANKFRAPPPIVSSFGCTEKIGGQLVIITQSGPIPMSSIAQGVADDPALLGPWGKISTSWAEDYANFGSIDGWSSCYHNGVAYFNIITGTTTSKQYVYNTRSSAWTTYTNLPAGQFASTGAALYFSQYEGGKVYLHQGGTDDGAEIIATARQSFTYPSSASLDPNVSKKYTMLKAIISADGPVSGQFQVDVDFDELPINSKIQTVTDSTGTVLWDSDWDTDWSSDPTIRRKWHPLTKRGVAVAPVVRLYSVADNAKWDSSQIVAIPGGTF